MTKVFPQTTVTMSLALHHGDWTIVWENTFVIATRNLNSRLEKYFYATRNLNSPLGKCFCYQIIARKLWQSSGEMLLPVHCNKDIVTISLLQIWKHLPWLSHFQKHSRDDCYNSQTTVTISLLLDCHNLFATNSFPLKMWITMEFFCNCKSRVPLLSL